jgi:hypothetical protein
VNRCHFYLEQVYSSTDVVLVVVNRLRDRLAHVLVGGQMKNGIEFVLFEDGVKGRLVSDVELNVLDLVAGYLLYTGYAF